jgi:hypothetical protein
MMEGIKDASNKHVLACWSSRRPIGTIAARAARASRQKIRRSAFTPLTTSRAKCSLAVARDGPGLEENVRRIDVRKALELLGPAQVQQANHKELPETI